MKRCKRCLLREGKFSSPEGDINVILDENGMCNFCHYFDKHLKPRLDYNSLQQQFEERINTIRGKYRYDALVGLSGGKDSTYILYQLVKKYKLNILVVTYDNSFLTNYARTNIEKLLTQFNVTHIFYHPKKEYHRKLYKAATLKLANPCTACATAGYFLALKFCHEYRIPFFLHGRSPYQMFSTMCEGTKDLFINILTTNLEKHSFAKVSNVYRELHLQVRSFIKSLFNEQEEAENIVNEFFLDPSLLSSEFAPESLSYYLFHPYNEEKIKQQLSHELGWERGKNDSLLSHADCKIHDAVNYIYRKTNDIDLIEPEIASMLRMGDTTLENAEKIIKDTWANTNIPRESIKALCDLCQIDESSIDKLINNVKPESR